MGNLGKEHQQAVKRIFKYLNGTIDIGLVYHGNTYCALAGYSDSNFAIHLDAKRSMFGHVFTIGNSLINWKETLQLTVALSIIEAQYMALVEAIKEGIKLKGLISNLRFPQENATIFYGNLFSQGSSPS